MIYFLQSVDGGPVKIGTTNNLDVRRQSLESLYKCKLAVLAVLPGGRTEEKAIHKRFAPLRFGRTEQFRPSADLMAFIGRPLLVGANPDAVESMEPRAFGSMLTLRGSAAWRAWIDELREHDRSGSVADLIDRALVAYARQVRFPKLPPER